MRYIKSSEACLYLVFKKTVKREMEYEKHTFRGIDKKKKR